MKTTKIITGAALLAICITNVGQALALTNDRTKQAENRSERMEQIQLKATGMQERRDENVQKRTELKKENATKEIDRRIASLKDLRSKITAETDATKLIELKKSIIESYRIYALFMPKITLIAHADQVISTATLMKTRTTADSEAWKQIDSGEIKAKQVISDVIGLLPSGYPASKTTLENARTLLKDANKDLNLARPMLTKPAITK